MVVDDKIRSVIALPIIDHLLSLSLIDIYHLYTTIILMSITNNPFLITIVDRYYQPPMI